MKFRFRSFLFVPADNDRLITSSLKQPCDIVILDLEDGTHPSRKTEARNTLTQSYARLKEAGKAVAVRINGDLNTAVTDLRAAVNPGLDLVVLPKIEHPRDVQLLSALVADLESMAHLKKGSVQFLLQIESAAALPKLYDIAAADPRVMGMMLGSEDFSLDCGSLPMPEALTVPSMMVLHASRAAGIQPIGFIASIANLGDVAQFREKLEQARTLGFYGAMVVHPKFLEAINTCYTPTPAEVTEAREIVSAFDAAFAEGKGAIKVNDKMIDKPVYLRARALLERMK
ncbi:MAG: CoA ester lyase [Oxalobacter sp.]|nr:MAG: CoA ester lyase [Oxalobacter sp.]